MVVQRQYTPLPDVPPLDALAPLSSRFVSPQSLSDRTIDHQKHCHIRQSLQYSNLKHKFKKKNIGNVKNLCSHRSPQPCLNLSLTTKEKHFGFRISNFGNRIDRLGPNRDSCIHNQLLLVFHINRNQKNPLHKQNVLTELCCING